MRNFLVASIIIMGMVIALLGVLYANRANILNSVKSNVREKIKRDLATTSSPPTQQTKQPPIPEERFTFAALTDIHNNIAGLDNAVQEINQSNARFTIAYGDLTDVGTEKELAEIYKSMQKLAQQAYVLPGDHDVWNGRDKTDDPFIYFNKQFKTAPQTFVTESTRFIFINNADLYNGIPKQEYAKLLEDIDQATEQTIIVNAHKAVYAPLTIHRMGYINEKISPVPYMQALEIMRHLESKNNSKIYLLHGDLHSSGISKGPTSNIFSISIGALTVEKNFQSPRYSMITVHKDGSVSYEDREVRDAK